MPTITTRTIAPMSTMKKTRMFTPLRLRKNIDIDKRIKYKL
jgi:hypothetical protein